MTALTVIAGLLWVAPVQAQTIPDLSWLDPAEREWLARHPVVRVGVDPDYAPYAFFDDQGRYQGVSADIVERLGAMLGIRLEVVRLGTWAEVLEAARDRRIDMITTASRRPEREDYLAFTREYLQTPLVVMTRADMTDMASPDEVATLRVALVRDYGGAARVLERYPGVRQVWVHDAVEALAALATGRADAYVGVLGVSQHLARLHGYTNLRVNVGFDLRSNAQTMAVRKDWAPLAAILDRALERLPADERVSIEARWLNPSVQTPTLDDWPGDVLRWLAQAPVVRVGYVPDALPFEGRGDNGQPMGLLVESLEALRVYAGFTLQWVPGTPEALAQDLQRRDVDAVLHRRVLRSPGPDHLATDPLYVSSLMLVCPNRGHDCSGRLEDYVGQDVAVRQGSEAHDRLRLKPQVRVHAVASDEQALAMLRGGKVHAVFGEARSLQRALAQAHVPLDSVRFGPAANLGLVQYRMAVRGDWPELVTVINRSMPAIGEGELARVRQQWVGSLPPPEGLDPLVVWRSATLAIAVGALVLGGLLWVNHRQRHEIRRRLDAEIALARERDRAEQASLHKSRFVAQTSHELRTPLNAVIGVTRLLQEAQPSREQQELLRLLDDASHSLLALVDDLLDLARIESGQLSLVAEPFDPARCTLSAVEQLRDAAQRKGLALHVDIDPELPASVEGDAKRLRQVLLNLLGNAIKYTAEGEVALQLQLQRRDDARATLAWSVSDTGPGIAPEWHERIFQPFERAAAGTPGGPAAGGKPVRLHTDGVGLGLAVAREMVRRMGGELTLDSRVGEGSRFAFEIELTLADEPRSAEPAPSRMSNAAVPPPGRALLVEDDAVNAMLARAVLTRGGWDVVEAASGAQAMEALGRDAAALDVVLMDVGLPDIDGMEVTRRLRAMGGSASSLPVLGLTARAMPEERAACLAAGMNDVVLKPFDIAELWTAIGRVRRPLNG